VGSYVTGAGNNGSKNLVFELDRITALMTAFTQAWNPGWCCSATS